MFAEDRSFGEAQVKVTSQYPVQMVSPNTITWSETLRANRSRLVILQIL